jgi:hypothetical protein
MSQKKMTYLRFLKWRGITDPQNPTLYLTRGVISCWFEAGFHRFWQKWNPPIGFLAFKLYVTLRKVHLYKAPATIISFVVIGLAHDIIGILIIGRFTLKATMVFLSFSGFTVLSRRLQSILRQSDWPSIVNALVNAFLIYISFLVGETLSSKLAL